MDGQRVQRESEGRQEIEENLSYLYTYISNQQIQSSMKNMRLPGKISNKQQAQSQLWLDTLTETEKNHSAEIRIPNALRAVMSTPKSITDKKKKKIPQWQEGLGCNLFQ